MLLPGAQKGRVRSFAQPILPDWPEAPIAHLTDLIVVLPGIGGSTLNDSKGRPVWSQKLHATASTVLRHVDRLDIDSDLRPSGILWNLSALPWMSVPGYDKLDEYLRRLCDLDDRDVDVSIEHAEPNLLARLVYFPYDFREPTTLTAERLAWDLDRRLKALGPNTRVVIIGHSMGGLVARWWWSKFRGYKVCRRLITVGTPHRGSPKAMDWLVNGVAIGGQWADTASRTLLPDVTQVLRGWPSIYELLPRYPAVLTQSGPTYPHQLSFTSDDFRKRAAGAYAEHLALESAVATAIGEGDSESRQVLALYSIGHATPSRATSTDKALFVTKEDPEWLPNVGWMGDGTVPAISAIPIEHSEGEDVDHYRRFAPESHIAMTTSRTLFEYLRVLFSDSLSPVRGREIENLWFGFDHDDVLQIDESAPIGVRLWGGHSGHESPRLSLLAPEERRFAESIKMDKTADGWSAWITPRSQGMYRVKVEVDNLGSADRLSAYSAFGVVRP